MLVPGSRVVQMALRNPTALTQSTRMAINRYLGAGSRARERVVEALAAVATKPNHPYHAKWLYKYLSRYRWLTAASTTT